jgi:hypothetical protein
MNVFGFLTKKHNIKNRSINDIKSLFTAEKYTCEVLKLSSKNIDDSFISEIASQVSEFSVIHRASA